MTISSQKFKDIFSKIPTIVTVVTTLYEKSYWGFTASSFKSVSLDPQLVMFSLNKFSNSFEAFANSENFCISILSSEQQKISENFSTKYTDKFTNINYFHDTNNIPIIKDSLGFFSCRKYNIFSAGDHSIIIGEVITGDLDESKTPLIYYNRDYAKNWNIWK